MRPVPEYDAKSWLLKALRETAHAMEALLWELDEDALEGSVEAREPADDEWTCAEVVAHMCAMERRFYERLERVTKLDEPRISAFDADSIGPCGDVSVYEAIDDLAELRRRSVHLLWSLDDSDWRRKGVHPYLGPLSIQDMAREMNEHDLCHLWQLRRLCDRLVAASV
jgi:hypothetical protein